MARRRGPSQRPETWRFNHSSPLANGLVFAHLGQCIGSTTYRDSSVYNADGTLTGFTGAGNLPQDRWTWSPELGRYGLSFDGSNDYVAISSNLSKVVLNDTDGFTVTGWVSFAENTSTWKTIFTKTSSTLSNRQFFVGQNGGFSCPTNGLTFFTNQISTGGRGTPAVTVNRMYFFAAVHTGATNGNALYVWSSVDGMITGSDGTSSPTLTGVDADAGTNPVLVGRFNSINPYLFKGFVADPCLWTRPLSLSEISPLANPSNVDLRIGATPLLLPVRRYWGTGFNTGAALRLRYIASGGN